CLKPGLQWQDAETRLPLRQLFELLKRSDAGDIAELVLGQDLDQSVRRALTPARDQYLLPVGAQLADMFDRHFEYVDVGLCPFLGEVASGRSTGVDDRSRTVWRGERRQPQEHAILDDLRHFIRRKIKPGRLHRLIRYRVRRSASPMALA